MLLQPMPGMFTSSGSDPGYSGFHSAMTSPFTSTSCRVPPFHSNSSS